MKLRVLLPCQSCDREDHVLVELGAAWWEWDCASCGARNEVLTHVNFTLGWRVLERSKVEYVDNNDYSMSIVLAAMAVDTEVARLYFKWRRIDCMREERRRPTDEELDAEYRSLGTNVADKIKRVARLLYSDGIDGFVRSSPALASQIAQGYPSLNIGSLPKDIQEAIFWPRNRVLHAGFLDYDADDAKRITNVASMVLALFKEMDQSRQRTPGATASP